METFSGPAEMGETKKLEMPDIRILNEIHQAVGYVMRGFNNASRMPRWVFLGRDQYKKLLKSTFLIFKTNVPDYEGNIREAEYVFGIEIVHVDRDDFLEVM